MRVLLSWDRTVANVMDLEGNLPIHLLASCAHAIGADEKQELTTDERKANCQKCLSLYLGARPRAEGHLLMGLQGLPDWLRDYAVLSPVVQRILNVKIAMRFPTAVTLMDFFFYVIVIFCFQIAVVMSLKDRANDTKDLNTNYLIPLFMAAIYFFMREIVQMLSLATMGQFKTWAYNFENWLDTFYIFLVVFWSIVMALEALPDDFFQPAAALSIAVFWVMILNFLQGIIVGFAVFVRGVLYVTKRLAAFLVSLVIILFSFTQIFHTLFQQSKECPNPVKFDFDDGLPLNITTSDRMENTDNKESCEPIIDFPYCDYIQSFISVFTMLLGEVKDNDFVGSEIATFFYALFMFSCVIVLASVLIAVVVDSYRVIQNERAGEF